MGNTYVGVTSRSEWDDENLLAVKKDNVSSNEKTCSTSEIIYGR